jgi:hypothetical protein
MKKIAYIQKLLDGSFVDSNAYTAELGFSALDFEIRGFTTIDRRTLKPNRDEIVCGTISSVKTILTNLNINIPDELNYPKELSEYLGRFIWSSKIKDVLIADKYPIFIKPLNTKMFDGLMIESPTDIAILAERLRTDINDLEILCSEPVNFLAEYRCFIHKGKIVDIRKYKGSWEAYINPELIKEMVEKYKTSPIAYSLDIGITDDCKNLLVEANDAYSIGHYGLDPIEYAKLLYSRWCEIVNVPNLLL